MMKLLFCGLLSALLAQPVWAADASLRDPTRPADAVFAGADEAGASVYRLDMVIRPVAGKPSAVINGETLRVGDEIQGMKLVAIREASVLLRGADGKETITLAPGVEKIMRSTQINRPAVIKRSGGGM